MKIKALGFDLDGTIIDSIEASADWITRAANQTMKRSFTKDEVIKEFGKPEPDILKALCPGPEAARAFAAYQKLLTDEFARVRILPGMLDVLEACASRGVPMGLYTSRGSWATGVILDRLNLRRFFKSLVAGDHVGLGKPDPEGILYLCAELRANLNEFLYVGDSDVDVQAAKNARVHGRQVLWGPGTKRVPGEVLNEPAELLQLLG